MMKTRILAGTLAVMLMMVGTSVMAQEDKDAKKAREKIADGQKDLKEAKIDSAADYQKFVKDAQKDIYDNKGEIAKLKAKQAKDNKNDQEEYSKKVLALERDNDMLEKRINGSEHTKTNMWEKFKKDFNHDMKKLGEDIKRI